MMTKGFGSAWGMDAVADEDPDGVGFITAHMRGFGEPSFGPFSIRNWNTSRQGCKKVPFFGTEFFS